MIKVKKPRKGQTVTPYGRRGRPSREMRELREAELAAGYLPIKSANANKPVEVVPDEQEQEREVVHASGVTPRQVTQIGQLVQEGFEPVSISITLARKAS